MTNIQTQSFYGHLQLSPRLVSVLSYFSEEFFMKTDGISIYLWIAVDVFYRPDDLWTPVNSAKALKEGTVTNIVM